MKNVEMQGRTAMQKLIHFLGDKNYVHWHRRNDFPHAQRYVIHINHQSIQ